MDRVDKPSSKRQGRQWGVFFLSLCVLGSMVGLVSLLISLRPEVEMVSPEPPQALLVNTLEVHRSTYPVKVRVYGEASASKSMTMKAHISGTVRALSDLFEGKRLEPGEALFQIDPIKQKLAIEELEVELKELELNRSLLEREGEILSMRIETAKGLVETAQAALEKEKQLLEIEKQLFQNSEDLYAQETISNTEFLQAEAELRSRELKVLSSHTALRSRRDALDQLLLNLASSKKEKENTVHERAAKEIQIRELQNDVDKARIGVDVHAQITSLSIEEKQEVTAGSTLAVVRPVDRARLKVDLPDSYFRWLYSGDLFLQANGMKDAEGKILIELVNREFVKEFKGGYIQSIGESLDEQTRSLPITIERINPVDEQGHAISKEELKPGMYCRVTLVLDEVSSAFLVPYSAIQSNGSLVVAEKKPEEKGHELVVYDSVEQLHEGPDGVLLRLPEGVERVRVVTDQMRSPIPGWPLILVSDEGE